jgi:hypothetical protein
MFRSAFCLLSVSLVSGALYAQTPNPTMTEMKAAYNTIKTNLMKTAEKVSEEDYKFRAAPDVRSIGELLEHIASAHIGYCGRLSQNPKAPDFGAHSKADITNALKASFDVCDAGWDALNESNASEMTGQGGRALSKYGAMMRALIHDNEEYGYLSVYLRLKGIVPPSSDAAGRGGRGN